MAEPDFEKALRTHGPLTADELESGGVPKVYRQIGKLEENRKIRIGFKRKGNRGLLLCYLPEQEEDLKKGKYGMVYLPVEKVVEGKPEASRDDVLRYIKEIDAAATSNNWKKCHAWIKELRQVCIHNRTGSITELLDAINRYVNTPELFESEEVREDLAETMSYILNNEKESGAVKTANGVIAKLGDSAREIALYDRKMGCFYAFDFLSGTADKQSVDVIMTVISQVSEEAKHRQIIGNFDESIHSILYDSELAKQQSGYIQEKLVDLSESEDEAVRSFIRRLQEKPRFHS